MTEPIAKLRALYAAHEAHEGRGDERDQVARECALLEAIPALLDVAEAAHAEHFPRDYTHAGFSPKARERLSDTCPTCAALARLDEVMRD